MIKFLAPLVLFLLLLVLFAAGLKLNPREVPSPLIGKPAPAFRLATLEDLNREVTQEIFKGKISLLNVWASWCLSCREEHPFLLELARRGEVQVLGLNYKDDRSQALRWLAQLGNPYELSLYDPTGRVALDYGVYGVPETFLIDQEGIIRYKQIGPLTEEVWREEIVPIIEKLKATGNAFPRP